MRKYVRRVLATAHVRGDAEAIERLAEVVGSAEVDAIALVGDLAGKEKKPEAYRRVFKALGRLNLPSFFVPGPGDAPVHEYLREAYNIEVVFPFLHGVHGTFAFSPGYVVFAGMGGAIEDDPDFVREEVKELRYPGWEAEYRLKVLRELKDYQKVFLFSTAPEHKGLGEKGSEEVAELIKTYSPRVAIVAGPNLPGADLKHEMLGSTLVVMPGSLSEGDFSIVDLHDLKIETGNVR
jgi:Icc-related predicted phosphoesterase